MVKSKLFGSSCYLCGSMDRVPDGGVRWRNELTPILNKLGVIVLDPCDKPVQGEGIEDAEIRDVIKGHKSRGEYDVVKELVRPIRQSDMRMVDRSDFLVVHLDLEHYPCGTWEEIFWANRGKKPILIKMANGKATAPHWLFGCIPHEHIFSSWIDMLNYLKDVASGKDERTFKRWVFFDMEGPTRKMLEAYGEN